MNRLVLLFALFFAPCLVAEPPNLAPPGSAREQLNRFTTGLETLQARFEQKVISGDGAVEDSSGGEV